MNSKRQKINHNYCEKLKTQSRLAIRLGAGSQMHLQLIKNAQVQPWVVQPAEPVSLWQRCSCVCTPFLMAAGVDDPPDLGLNFKRKFRADVFYNLFMAKQKKTTKIMKTKYEEYELFPTARNKAFWIWFFSCKPLEIYDLWLYAWPFGSTAQEKIASGSSIASSLRSATAVL